MPLPVFDRAGARVFAHLGESVTFIPGDAASYAVQGVRNINVEHFNEQTGTIERKTVWRFLLADLHRAPVAGDQINSTYGLETVKGILPAGDDGLVVKVVVG